MSDYRGITLENGEELVQVEMNGHPNSFVCASFNVKGDSVKFLHASEMNKDQIDKLVKTRNMRLSNRRLVAA